MRLTRLTAIVTAAALVAPLLPAAEYEPSGEVHTTIDTFWVDIVPYEQPCEDLPVFDYAPPPGEEFSDLRNWPVWAIIHEENLFKEKELGKAVDRAQRSMILNTVNLLRYAARSDHEKASWANSQKWRWTFEYYKALYTQFEYGWTSREDVKSEYFDPFIRLFPTFTEAQQQEALDAFEERMTCLQVARRGAFATIQEQRKKYAEHLKEFRREQLSPFGTREVPDEDTGEPVVAPSERTLEEAGRAAQAVVALTNAERAYLWLVADSTLNAEIYSRLLEKREEYLRNTTLHELQLDTYRSNPDLGPHDQPPVDTRKIDAQEEILKLRARRAVLYLYLEDQKLEAGFRRSASWLQSNLDVVRRFRDNGRLVWEGRLRNPDWSIEDGTTLADLSQDALGAFAVLFKLGGDVLNTMIMQPLVDGFKDTFIKPMLNPWGLGIQNSVEKAYDDYWKARGRLDERIRFLRKLERELNLGQAVAFIEWARTPQEATPEATGLGGVDAKTLTSLLEDGFFIEATGGGLPHIFAALTENPGDLTALYVTGAYYHQRGNAKAGASRLAVNRAVRDAATGDGELGRELVERIINPMGRLEVDADAGFLANWAYLAWELPTTFAVDVVWNAPTLFKLLVAYNTNGNPINQDEYLQGLQKRQGDISGLKTMLAASSFDYDRMAEFQLSGYLTHMGLLETSHEYCSAYRKIRAGFWEREKQWIWVRHEDEQSRRQGVDQPPRLSATGTWAEGDPKAQEDMEMARLAFKEGVLRARYLAYTGAYAAAASQLRQLEPVAAAYYTAFSKKAELAALHDSFAAQIEAMEGHAVREEAVAVYDGLYKTALTETAVSLVSTRLVNSQMGRVEGSGRAAFNPQPSSGGWSPIKTRLWQSLNPWAGKFSQAGVRNVVQNAAIQGFRESMSQTLAESLASYDMMVSQQAIDHALEFLFSVAEESIGTYAERLAEAEIDREVDTELYRARHEATRQLDQQLETIETSLRTATDEATRQRLQEKAVELRALRTLITGDARDPEIVEAALSQLSKLNGEALRDHFHDEVGRKVLTPDGSLDLSKIPEDVKTVLRLGMRDRLHSQAVTTHDIQRLLDPEKSLKLSDHLFKNEQFDIQTLRHALVRAAANDPQRSVELLAVAMALDQRRERITESLVDQLTQDQRFDGKLTVLRENNRVAVIGADPTRRGGLDAPGIFVDREYDIVVRKDADVDPQEVRKALDDLLAREGYAPPDREGARNGLGARFHFQSEAEIIERGRKSGQRSRLAKEYLGDQDPDPTDEIREAGDPPMTPQRISELSDQELVEMSMDPDLASKMESDRGFKLEHAQRMHLMAQLLDAIVVVRNGNPASLKYTNDPNYIPKDQTCKAKTAKVGPHVGLVVDPTHRRQKEYWDQAIEKARAEGRTADAEGLERSRRLAVETWYKYRDEMINVHKYTVTDEGLVTKAGKLGIHGDYDLHEVFVKRGGRWVRVSLGDGSETDNANRAGFRTQANSYLTAESERYSAAKCDMFLHGGQGDWWKPGPKSADPPVTIFVPKSVTDEFDIKSGHLAADADALRDFYENKLGTGWAYADGHGDLEPAQGIYRDRLFQSVGGDRWQRNRDLFGVEIPAADGIPRPISGWIPIPEWQAYGLAVDLLPKLDYLADPAFEAAAIEALANDRERSERLAGALLRVDGFFELVEAWLISQPEGNRIYNTARPEWLQEQLLAAPAAPAATAATTDAQLDELADAARKLDVRIRRPRAAATGHRRSARWQSSAPPKEPLRCSPATATRCSGSWSASPRSALASTR